MVVSVIVVVIVIALAVVFTRKKQSEPDKPVTKTATPKPILPPPTGPPGADGPYKHAVVASDAGLCSEIGRDILKKGGSAMDSAVAALFCIGVYNMHSAGVGGGGFMVVYNKSTRFVEVIDFREEAPGKASRTMYVGGKMNSRVGMQMQRCLIKRQDDLFEIALCQKPITGSLQGYPIFLSRCFHRPIYFQFEFTDEFRPCFRHPAKNSVTNHKRGLDFQLTSSFHRIKCCAPDVR